MRLHTALFAGGTFVLTFAAIALYRRVWISSRGSSITPTGFGVLLPIVIFAGLVMSGAPREFLFAFAILTAASVIYWFDDLFELSARLRLGLAFVAGIALCACVLAGMSFPLWMLCGFCVAAGIVNVVLTNIVNFYDGADLNLGTFILLTGLIMSWYQSADAMMAAIAIACIAFIIPFGVINSRPRTIYLGDAGSFAFAGLLTLLAVLYFSRGELSPEIAIPLVLPAIDTCYVFCIRVIERHDLMTRNYLHLYQKLNQNYRGFAYLLPQIINAGLLLAGASLLQAWGVERLLSVAIVSVVLGLPFYFLCRKLFVPTASRVEAT